MVIRRRWRLFLSLLAVVAHAAPAPAQQSPASSNSAPAGGASTTKKPVKHKPPTAPETSTELAPAVGGAKPTLLGQYGDWGAYTASPSGKKICFAIAKPATSEINPAGKTRNPAFLFVASRPADKVTNEVSVIAGYPFKPASDANAQIGSSPFALYTQLDGAWIKNAADEAQMVDALRSGDTAVITRGSAKGTQTTDTYSLKGVAQALDRVAQECK